MFGQGSTCLALLWIPLCLLIFRLRDFHPLWSEFPKPFGLTCRITYAVRTPQCTHLGLASTDFARRYFRYRCFFLFLRLLRCFSSPGSLPYVMDWRTDDWLIPAGFPHSDICGSLVICTSPQLFAAYHVFHRLLVPRHPPCALFCFTSLRAQLSSYSAVHSVAPFF